MLCMDAPSCTEPTTCRCLFIYTLCTIDGNILHHASSCNKNHEGNFLILSSTYHVTIELTLLFTSPVFSHFLGLTLIISISHLSAYSYHLLQCDSELREES